MIRIDFANTTDLCSNALLGLFRDGAAGWSLRPITVRVRYSRGADFSGTCFYGERRIYVNVGRHVVYPYSMGTNLARAKSIGRRWYKPIYTIELGSGYELAVFVFMHELYHLLVKRARRNTRQKESMCDRFAAKFVVSRFGSTVRDERGTVMSPSMWDYQDVEGFVAAARDRRAARRPVARNREQAAREVAKRPDGGQLLLFDT
ncbi:MAG: ImmA/IrrE family metallo-endopeptidase [Phycisphaerae bacterium]